MTAAAGQQGAARAKLSIGRLLLIDGAGENAGWLAAQGNLSFRSGGEPSRLVRHSGFVTNCDSGTSSPVAAECAGP